MTGWHRDRCFLFFTRNSGGAYGGRSIEYRKEFVTTDLMLQELVKVCYEPGLDFVKCVMASL